eukprot:jgi/Undpi1/5163/HiC_scaffold_19.g08514.m1
MIVVYGEPTKATSKQPKRTRAGAVHRGSLKITSADWKGVSKKVVILASTNTPREWIWVWRATDNSEHHPPIPRRRVSTCVRLDDAESSKKIDVAQGLRHECVLAPLLFNTVFMVVLRAAGKFFPADAAIMDNNMVQLQRKNKKGEKKGTQHTRKVDGRGWGEKEKVEMKPDLDATKFSPQNAYFFARLSKMAYRASHEVQGLLVGNSTSAGLGFDRFHWFEAGEEANREYFDSVEDTEAFVAANDRMMVVVFRGTMEMVDWATNLKITRRSCPSQWKLPGPGGNMHEGFDDGVDTVWESSGMHSAIKSLYYEYGKNRKLYVAGHSLGGALATVAAARLALGDNMDIAGIYTIGSPRIFDEVSAKHFDSKINHGVALKDKYFRSRNNNDIVPRVPASPFIHVGTEIYLDRLGTISATGVVDRLLGRMSAYLRGEFIEDINDHATSEYVRLFEQLVINSRVPLLDKTLSVVVDALENVAEKAKPGAVKHRGEPSDWSRLKEHIEDIKEKAREAAQEL